MPRLSRFLAAVVLVAVAGVLAGCFRMASVLTVAADGTATLVERVTFSDQALAFMAMADSAAGPLADPEKLAARAAALGPGVTVQAIAETDSGYTVTYAVADVTRLRFTPAEAPTDRQAEAPPSTQPPFTFTLARTADGTATLGVEVPSSPSRDAAADTATVNPAQQRQALAMARTLLGDARMSVHVAVDGRLLETDARYRDADAVTLLDVEMGALLGLLEDHPELMGGTAPPVDELARLTEGRDGLQIQPPGRLTLRFR